MLTISLSRNTFIYRAPIDFLVRGSYVFNDPWFRDGSPMERKVGMDAQGASRNDRVRQAMSMILPVSTFTLTLMPPIRCGGLSRQASAKEALKRSITNHGGVINRLLRSS